MSKRQPEPPLSPHPVLQASATIEIDAPIGTVWNLVANVANLATYSSDCAATEWSNGGSAPVVGATFKGFNERGGHQWQTECTITDFQPERRLALFTALGIGDFLVVIATGAFIFRPAALEELRWVLFSTLAVPFFAMAHLIAWTQLAGAQSEAPHAF